MPFSLHTIKSNTAPLAWLLTWMLILAPVGPHAVAGVVLCIESNGQAVLERAVGLQCGPTVQETSHHTDKGHTDHSTVRTASPANGVTHCESCIDIVLPSGGDDD